MLAHVPSFGQNASGSLDLLAYPVPKGCMHLLRTGVLRCLGVARSALSPKAGQTLGCSLTPGLRVIFGRVTCMARAASVPMDYGYGHWVSYRCVVLLFASGFRGKPAIPGWGVGCVCVWIRVLAPPCHSWLWFVVRVFGIGFRGNPAIPGWGLGYVCLGTGLCFAPPLLHCGFVVCASVFGLFLHLAIPSWVVRARSLLRALRPFTATPGWGRLW